jgi:pantothenate kinase
LIKSFPRIGSGKTTSASILADMLNDCIVIPMDGYHYPIDVLQKFSDPEDAIYRRGAPDTFDSSKLQADLERIKNGNEEATIYIPGFDHAIGDPEPNKHCFIRQQHKVVLCEGLYLLHDKDGWDHVSKLLDYTIYITANLDACIARLKERNKCIPGYTPEQIDLRCEAVDRVNAEIVEHSKTRAHLIVRSGAAKFTNDMIG